MLKMIALIGVGTAIAYTSPTIAKTAPAASAAAATAPTGARSSQMRHRANMSKQRARPQPNACAAGRAPSRGFQDLGRTKFP